MGTRSLIKIKDDKKTILCIYQQYDGSLGGVGLDIYNILNHGRSEIINEFSGIDASPDKFNGMGCLATFLLARIKLNQSRTIGGVYIYPPSAEREEYNYTLTDKNGIIYMRVTDWSNKVLYNDKLNNFRKHITNLERAV